MDAYLNGGFFFQSPFLLASVRFRSLLLIASMEISNRFLGCPWDVYLNVGFTFLVCTVSLPAPRVVFIATCRMCVMLNKIWALTPH
jgi:hypothetical protein